MQRLCIEHGGYRFGSHLSIWGNAGETRERLCAMTGLRNGPFHPINSSYAYHATRAVGNDRLVIRMGLQRQHLRAVGLNQHVVGKICQLNKRNRWCGKLTCRLVQGPNADDRRFRQCFLHLVKRGFLQHRAPIRHEHFRAGGDDNASGSRLRRAARQLLGQRAYERGLPASTDNGRHPWSNVQ